MKKQYLLICALICLGIGSVKAQYTNLLTFNGRNGEYPAAAMFSAGSLILSGNVLYGMASAGGAYNDGCIFSIHTNGSAYKDLLDFNDTNGTTPLGSLTLSRNILYGMTSAGSVNGYGCVFSVDTNGSGFTDLHDFKANSGGGISLTLANNVLYGITAEDNSTIDICYLFSIHTDGTGFKVVATFNDSNQIGGGSVVLSGKTLYGVISQPYGPHGVFSVDTDGNGYKILNDTIVPNDGLAISGNKLFGVSSSYGGYVFLLDTDGSNCKTIYNFSGNSSWPNTALTLWGTTLYGGTRLGGTYGGGVLYSVDTSGSGYTSLYSFPVNKNGQPLPGNLIIAAHVLYGMTFWGGVDTVGNVFSFKDTVTGIDELAISSEYAELFPDPNKGVFTIEIKGEEPLAKYIEVYNMLGEKVFTKPLSAGTQNNVDMGNQPTGIYLYRVFTKNGDFISGGKFVIQ